MKEIKGFPINFDINTFSRVSDLIYYDGPLLSHYINTNGDNYLFLWVDNNDVVNRWIVVRVTFLTIQRYVKQKITLLDLLYSAIDNTTIVIDLNNDIETVNSICAPISSIPEEYLPDADSFYIFKPVTYGDDFNRLRQFNNSSLEIHITGRNVGYGDMHYDDFVSVNQKIYALWDKLSSKYLSTLCENYKETYRKRSVPHDQKISFQKIMQMDYTYAMAGSVRLILTPRDKDNNVFESASDGFIREFSNILECGNQVESIREYTEKYGPELMYNYKELVDLTYEKQLNIGVNHYCKADDMVNSVSINDNNKNRIIANLSSEIVDTEVIEIIGKFYSINTKKYKYGFSSVEDNGDESDGQFDSVIHHFVPSLSFTKLYKVRILRNIKQKMTKRDRNYDKMIDITPIIPEHVE